MNEEELIVVLEQIDRLQTTLQQFSWDCVRQIEDVKCRIESDFPCQVSLSRLKFQLRKSIAELSKALDRR